MCNFRLQRYQHVVPRLDRAGALRIRRFDLPTHLAEQIDLPRRVESELIEIDGLLERPDQLLCLGRGGGTGIADAFALEDSRQSELLAVVRCGCVQARQALRARRLHLNARLDDPQVRHLEIEISRRGLIDRETRATRTRRVPALPPRRPRWAHPSNGPARAREAAENWVPPCMPGPARRPAPPGPWRGWCGGRGGRGGRASVSRSGAARLLDRREKERERNEAECQQRTIKKHVLVRQEPGLRDQGLIGLPQCALRGGRRGGP